MKDTAKFHVDRNGDEVKWDLNLDLREDVVLLFMIVHKILDIFEELGFDDEYVIEKIREVKRN